MGPKTLIIKRGEHGAMLWHGGEVFYAPAFPLHEVCDPTGAGDTFCGALLGYLASQDKHDHNALRRAVVYGSAVASHCVQGIAVDSVSSVTRRQVDTRVEEFRRLAEIPHADA